MSTLLSVGKYDVNAFAMLSLHDGGTVQVHTSKHIKSGCYSTLLSWAQSYLKNVHDNSIQNAESGSDSVEGRCCHIAVSEETTETDHALQAMYRSSR